MQNENRKVLISNSIRYGLILLLCFEVLLKLIENYTLQKVINSRAELYLGVAVALFLSLYIVLNKDLLLKNEKALRSKDEEEEQSREDLKKNYPKISSIPIIGHLFIQWKLEPLIYKLALIFLCIISLCLYTYELSFYDWLPDEPLVVKSAVGYLETGSFIKWDFWSDQAGNEAYKRAWPHTWLVAQSIKFFGLSELSSRIISSICGMLFVPIVYGVSSFLLKNRLAAILIAVTIMLNPYFIVYFRRVRMYAVLVPLFMLLFYLTYQTLTSKVAKPHFIYKDRKYLKTLFNYNWFYVICTLICLYFSIQIHKLSYVFFPAILPLVLYLILIEKQYRLLIPLVLGGLGILFLGGDTIGKAINQQFVYFEVYNAPYLEYLLDFPFSTSITVALLLSGLLFLLYSRSRRNLFALYSILAVTLVFYLYIINFPIHFRYILHLIPFASMLIIGIALRVNDFLQKKWQKAILPLLIVFLAISNFAKQYEWIYHKYPEAQFSSIGYETIKSKINPEKEGIIGLYLNEMYFKGYSNIVSRIQIPNQKQYTLQQLKSDIGKFEHGAWITWASHKSYHLRPEVHNYIARNCGKFHGYGIDETLIEVYICRNN